MKQGAERKIYKWMLIPAMAAMLLLGMCMTTWAEEEYPLWVNGIHVDEINASNITGTNPAVASYDATSNTLTLKGISINTGYMSAGIYYYSDNYPLKINLEGSNYISSIEYGIYGAGYDGALTFSGSGSLTITGTSIGIISYYRYVEISGGKIRASGTNSTGIKAQGVITINGGNVEAKGANYGISAMNGVNITGGTVTAEATNSTSDTGAAIYSGGGNGISITGGTVTAKGTSSSNNAYGLFMGSSGSITIGSGITSLIITGTTSASSGKVKNSVVGMGWLNVYGTGDGTEIAVNTGGASLDFRRLVFPYTKPAATVTTIPIAKSGLIYTGSAQALVTAGKASGGMMNYAISTSATTAPTTGWGTSIPTGTDAKTYYVWYKAVGDETHTDSDPACVTVTISAAPKDPDTPVPPAPTVERADIMLNSSFLVSWKGSNVEATWGTVPTADSYEVWATYCGTETFQNIQTIQGGNKAVISAFEGKPLDKKRCVKVYVIAKSGGVEVGRTLIGHAAGPKNRHTNVKKLKVKKRTYNLKVGKTAKIKVTTKKMKGGKSLLPKKHDPRLRYLSTNTNVATVSGKGKIKAVGAGTCDVWVYAQNGRSQKVTVVVQ